MSPSALSTQFVTQFNNATSPLRTGATTGSLDVTYPPQAVTQTACADGVYRAVCDQVQPTSADAPKTPVAAIAGGMAGLVVLIALGWYCYRRPAANTLIVSNKLVEMAVVSQPQLVQISQPAQLYQTQAVFLTHSIFIFINIHC